MHGARPALLILLAAFLAGCAAPTTSAPGATDSEFAASACAPAAGVKEWSITRLRGAYRDEAHWTVPQSDDENGYTADVRRHREFDLYATLEASSTGTVASGLPRGNLKVDEERTRNYAEPHLADDRLTITGEGSPTGNMYDSIMMVFRPHDDRCAYSLIVSASLQTTIIFQDSEVPHREEGALAAVSFTHNGYLSPNLVVDATFTLPAADDDEHHDEAFYVDPTIEIPKGGSVAVALRIEPRGDLLTPLT